MYPSYNATGGWTNEYDFCLDWNLGPHNVWEHRDHISITIIPSPFKSNIALYLPFHIKFIGEHKDIVICKK